MRKCGYDLVTISQQKRWNLALRGLREEAERNQMRTMTPEEYAAHQRKYGRQQALKDCEYGKEPSITVLTTSPVQFGLPAPHPGKRNAPDKGRIKPSKHKNRTVDVDGRRIHSVREANRLAELKLMEQSGLIADLKTQVPYVLAESVVLGGRKKPAIRYFADFTYLVNGALVVEDCKNPFLRKDPVFRLKTHLLKLVHGIEVVFS